jgi:hypothetical protein
MGNPPFNTPRETKGQTTTLWDKFIVYGLGILKENGYMAFITPANWRRPENTLFNLMVDENQLQYLHILGEKDAKALFGGISIRIDMYTVQHKAKYTNTLIVDELGMYHTFDLKGLPFLPNYAYDEIKALLAKEGDGIKVIFSSSIYEHRKNYVKKEQTEEFKYPIVHSMTQSGLGFLYTNNNTKGHFGQPKVLLNVGRHQYPYNDYEGKYGMSQIVFGLPITSKEEGDQMVEAMNTDDFKKIIKATKWGTFQTDYRMFKYFKPDFYKEFLKKPDVGGRRKTLRRETHVSSAKTYRKHS